MPTLNLFNATTTGFDWYVSGLNVYWDDNNYRKIVISQNQTADGSATPPAVIADTVYPPQNGTSYRTPTRTLNGLTAGRTYTLYAYAQAQNDLYYFAGSNTITLQSASTRPNNWSWWTSKNSGSSFNLTANEWNAFTNHINAFRKYYYGYTNNYNFTTAYSGGIFYYYMFNQCISAISPMNPSTSLPSRVSSGSTVTAYGLNRLRDALNSVYK